MFESTDHSQKQENPPNCSMWKKKIDKEKPKTPTDLSNRLIETLHCLIAPADKLELEIILGSFWNLNWKSETFTYNKWH